MNIFLIKLKNQTDSIIWTYTTSCIQNILLELYLIEKEYYDISTLPTSLILFIPLTYQIFPLSYHIFNVLICITFYVEVFFYICIMTSLLKFPIVLFLNYFQTLCETMAYFINKRKNK